MSWIRLDDTIVAHRKLLACSPSACWLYVGGLSHCQQQLSDGFIPCSMIARLTHVKRPHELAQQLVKAGLWHTTKGGFQVHDYLDFNESATHVKERLKHDRDRKHKTRDVRPESDLRPNGIQTASDRIPDDPSRARASHPIPSPPKISELKDLPNPKVVAAITVGVAPTNGAALPFLKTADARSKRPIFTGQRLTVFEWMFDDCTKVLGPLTEAFDLHAWFYELDALAATASMVIPKRDGGAWLHSQLLGEAARRGLPIAIAETTKKPSLAARMAAVVERAKREES